MTILRFFQFPHVVLKYTHALVAFCRLFLPEARAPQARLPQLTQLPELPQLGPGGARAGGAGGGAGC